MAHLTGSSPAAGADFLSSHLFPTANSSSTRLERAPSSDSKALDSQATLPALPDTPSFPQLVRQPRDAPPTKRPLWKRINLSERAQKELACQMTLFAAGWADATAGVLIPAMQAYYTIGYMTVSTLFVGQCVGFLTASVFTTSLVDKYGLGNTMFGGACVQCVGYIIISTAPPFAVLPCAYAVSGFGMALQDATANGFVVTLPNASQRLGILHGIYGIGALSSPLIGTVFIDAGIRFALFYLTTLGICLVTVALTALAFRFKPDPPEPNWTEGNEGEIPLDQIGQAAEIPPPTTTADSTGRSKLRELLSSRLVWIVSLFITVYVGTEVTIGGWTVTFLQQERNGGTRAGYVASGFWAGITLGRIVLPRFNLLVGERNVVFLYLALATGLEIIVWRVPNLVGDAVGVALVGVVLGPFYPNALALITKLTPRRLHTGIAGFVAATGQSGSAIFPFLTGLLAQKYSPSVLQPVLLALFGAMAVLWVWIPQPARRRE